MSASSPNKVKREGGGSGGTHKHHKKPRTSNVAAANGAVPGAGGAVPTSQTGSTPYDTGTGQHFHTQLIYAVGYLKEHPNTPMRLEELAIYSKVEDLLHNADLLAAFRTHEKVQWDEKTDLYSYKPDYLLKSNADLLALLRRYSPRGGMLVKKLQESWPNAKQAIEELEKEGKVMVIRTGGSSEREGHVKMVFWDELGQETAEKKYKVDEEFNTMWHSFKLPDHLTIARELEEGGMRTTSTIAEPSAASTANVKKPKGKKGANRKIKLQNTHLKELGIDLSKDFVKPGSASSTPAPAAKPKPSAVGAAGRRPAGK